ncbi:hypothetical protein CROQUDRAFT_106359 [Cronartium quercuum f. sp. fusiforme G11]|uniref:Uncharacterized protein n=1 Tax=Cronartium quercuum f. sp. fusiforme G11 TaxID=708437 RepID=A0A9P6NQ61_9BASI|nr:hypothetical protein CROQUDRAFT_106359 [Cronartium quercuum f. sp. fusiforme G11]
MAASETTKDVVAGWIGGAAGILISNPLEVLKVRLQTNPIPDIIINNTITISPSRSPSPVHHFNHYDLSNLALKYSIPPTPDLNSTTSSALKSLNPQSIQFNSTFNGLKNLWRQEGYRFLFAGAAAPILGLAFIDSCFFATYGKCMSLFDQDRERPDRLIYVFASGAFAGGCCALLQTPMLLSDVFLVLRIIIKTRIQVNKLSTTTTFSSTSTTPAIAPTTKLTISQIIQQIYNEGKQHTLPIVHQSKLYRLVGNFLCSPLITIPLVSPDIKLLRRRRNVLRLSIRVGGLMGFFRGLRPTLISSFVGSGITMGIFEYVFELLGRGVIDGGHVDS